VVVGWTGDASTGSAAFAVETLTVATSGAGSGTVTGSGISCGSICSSSFDQGTQVTLTATPAAGSVFAGWSGGGCSGAGPCVVTVSSDTSVAATFSQAPPAKHALSVNKSGGGSGTVTGTGISCGSTCSSLFDQGTQVTLTAAAAAGSVFAGWSGGGCSGTGSCLVTVNGDTTVTAIFNAVPAPSCTVPKVTGRVLAAAETAVTNADCRVGRVRRAFSARVKKGKVISQSPAPGGRLAVGSVVELTVSKGPKPKKHHHEKRH
jgi:hypothetical protein